MPVNPDPPETDPDPPVLTPVVLDRQPQRLLPAIREDLTPFLPALRGAAQLLAAAAVAELAARYAAPAVRDLAFGPSAPSLKPAQQPQTILIEEQHTVRRRIIVSP